MLPPPRGAIARTAAWQPKSVPFRLIPTTRSNSASSRLSSGPSAGLPATLHIASRRPHSSTARSTRASTSALLATFTRCAIASPPCLRSAEATSSAPFASRSPSTTRAPAPERTSATARPMPLAAPVTTAARPSRRKTSRTLLGMGPSLEQALGEDGAERGGELRVARVVGMDAVGQALARDEVAPGDEGEPRVAGRLALAHDGLEGRPQVGERGPQAVPRRLGVGAQDRGESDDRRA